MPRSPSPSENMVAPTTLVEALRAGAWKAEADSRSARATTVADFMTVRGSARARTHEERARGEAHGKQRARAAVRCGGSGRHAAHKMDHTSATIARALPCSEERARNAPWAESLASRSLKEVLKYQIRIKNRPCEQVGAGFFAGTQQHGMHPLITPRYSYLLPGFSPKKQFTGKVDNMRYLRVQIVFGD